MTAGSEVNLGMLLQWLLVDNSALAERMLQPVMDQLSRDGAIEDDGDTSPDLLIATALGNRLARLVAAGDPPGSVGGPAPSLRLEDLGRYEELIERNSALAAALGACDCWGQQPDCPFCDGAGAPGWVLPERQLFRSYVYPAVKAIKKLGVPPDAAERRTSNDQKENGHAGHVAR